MRKKVTLCVSEAMKPETNQNTKMKSQYAVYVSDANGWDRDCPSFEDVFFGVEYEYVHPVDDGIGPCGHVVVEGHSAAVALRDKLNTTGDWNTKNGVERPTYEIQKL